MVFAIRHNVLATLAYFDVFDFPLKAEEVFKFLIDFKHLGQLSEFVSDAQVKKELDVLVGEKTVGLSDGFYFLFGRSYLVPLRLKREKLAKLKMTKTIRIIHWLRLIPYLRAVFASGSLAMANTDELSDLDVLVVVRSGRIWLTRFLVTLCLSGLLIRRKASDKIAPNKICPNHYVTDKSLLIPFKSIYNAETYSNLVPLYTRDKNLIEEFKKENNWVLDYVVGWGNIDSEQQKCPVSGFRAAIAEISEQFLDTGLSDLLEKILRGYQSNRIAANPLTRRAGGRVVFNDKQLEFHPASLEEEIIKKYNERMIKLHLNELACEKNSGLTQ